MLVCVEDGDYSKLSYAYGMLPAGQLPAGVVVVGGEGGEGQHVALYGQPPPHDLVVQQAQGQYYGDMQTMVSPDYQATGTDKANKAKGILLLCLLLLHYIEITVVPV